MTTGYSKRNPYPATYSIILHTTNGRKNSSYTAEESFLFMSENVSAHFLVGKNGEITQLLPTYLAAWHSGVTFNPLYGNNNTIGIEMHFTPGEKVSDTQINTCHRLCQCLSDFVLIRDVQSHRTVAKPKGRKIDPSNMSDMEVDRFRDTLYILRYYTVNNGALLYTEPECINIATHITNAMYNQGAVRGMIDVFYGKQIKQSIWNSTGVGFHKLADCTIFDG
jgi:N-acetyl-anhydromuramyl-L-alanine amidase AmpD